MLHNSLDNSKNESNALHIVALFMGCRTLKVIPLS